MGIADSSSLRLILLAGLGLALIGLSGLYVGLGRKLERQIGSVGLALTAKPCLTERLGQIQPVSEPLVKRNEHAATLTATLQGAKGAGQLNEQLQLDIGAWTVRRAEVTLAGGGTLDLLTCEVHGGLVPQAASCDVALPACAPPTH
jgi:hypothetical protein